MAATSKAVAQQIKIPASYTCPIMHQIMIDPVVAADGYTYEREAIEERLKTQDISPKTGLKLKHKELTENNGKKEEILEFLEQHPELYEKDEVYLPKSWVSELIVAIKANKIKEVQELLTKDKRLLTLKLEGGYTAFHLACQFGSPELTENLLKMLESKNLLDKVSAKPDGFKPIHLNTLMEQALEKGDSYPFKPALLLKLGVDLEQADDSSGNSLLQKFVIQGNLEAIQWLIKQGVDLESRSRNLEGNTPLALSVLHGHTAVADHLLQSGASIEALSEQQKSPIYLAVERKDSKESQELIELLLSKGANPKVCCGTEKLTPLHIAARQGNIFAVKQLLKANVNVDALDASGNTPLHLAAQAGQKEVISLLLEAGASHKAKNADGKTPIAVAHSPIIAELIKQMARQVIESLRQLVKEQEKQLQQQAVEIEQLKKEVAKLKQKAGTEEDTKEKSEKTTSPVAFTPQYAQAQLNPTQPKPDLKVTAEEVQKFLNYVVAGAQPEAEEMLKKNAGLALATGTVTDHAKRTFKNITGFQYAVWALDWQMWRMIKSYLSKEAAEEQARGFAEGSWVKEYGEHADWKKLTEAQQTLIDNWQSWSYEKINEYWVQQIGGAQLLLPMHVLQEYNQPYRPFSPCPKFDADYALSRRALPCEVSQLGAWGGGLITPITINDRSDQSYIISYLNCGDREALESLFGTRTQQRAALVAELVKKPVVSPHK